jgi:hypothetical protein
LTYFDYPILPLTDGVAYGKTTQTGTPTPSAPIPLISISAGSYRYENNGNRYVVELPEMRSVGNTRDTWDADTGVFTRLEQKYALQASDITSISNGTYIQRIHVKKPADSAMLGNYDKNKVLMEEYPEIISAPSSDLPENIYKFRTYGATTKIELFVPLGTYANLSAAQTALAGTEILYQLATPIVSTIPPELVWQEPVTDHTANSFVDIAFLNRIEQACEFLEGFLNGKGYSVNITTKTDWVMADFPYRTQIDRIRSNVEALQTAFYSLPDWREITYTASIDFNQANALEWDLQIIDVWLQRMITSMQRYSGTFYAGEMIF